VSRLTNITALAALLAALALAVAACGGDGDAAAKKGPPGSPDNPLVSKASDEGSTPDAPGGQTKPNYKALLKNQSKTPAVVADAPCGLVTKKQAQTAIGMRLMDPVEAPQGPTCIYRDRGGKTFVTVAIQDTPFSQLRGDLHRLKKVSVGDRDAYCGVNGAPVLYLPLARARILSVTAQCEVAMDFARFAAPHLNG
jgi:hypothetical protein